MRSVADTDILSAFAKADGLTYLISLFESVSITPSVFAEVPVASRRGFAFADEIMTKMELLALTEEELRDTTILRQESPFLGNGEIESIVVAKHRGWVLLTN